jgi:hypothetical protein
MLVSTLLGVLLLKENIANFQSIIRYQSIKVSENEKKIFQRQEKQY